MTDETPVTAADEARLAEVLDRLHPAGPNDPAVLDRAYQRLVAEMYGGPRRDLLPPRRRARATQLVAGVAAAAAVAGGLAVCARTGSTHAPHNLAADTATSHVLLRLAAYESGLPAPGAGAYVKTVQTSYTTQPAPISGNPSATVWPAGEAPGAVAEHPRKGDTIALTPSDTTAGSGRKVTDRGTDIVYRPARLDDTRSVWVRIRVSPGPRAQSTGHCGGACTGGGWSNPSAAFVARIAGESPDGAAAEFLAYYRRVVSPSTGPAIAGAAMFELSDILQAYAGDPRLAGNLFHCFAALARAYPSAVTAEESSEKFRVTVATDKSTSESLTLNKSTGVITDTGRSGAYRAGWTVTTLVVRAADVPKGP